MTTKPHTLNQELTRIFNDELMIYRNDTATGTYQMKEVYLERMKDLFQKVFDKACENTDDFDGLGNPNNQEVIEDITNTVKNRIRASFKDIVSGKISV